MKRSDMIELLVNKHLELGPQYMSLEEKCKEILKAIEEVGMLPPAAVSFTEIPETQFQKRLINEWMESGDSEIVDLHMWEPEDETN